MSSLITITPPIAHLEFQMLVPPGWAPSDMPEQSPDFNEPKAFLALAVYVLNPLFGIVAVTARPAYDDGTVIDWIRFLAREEKFEVETCEPYAVGPHKGVSVLATQVQEAGTLRLRAAVFEDGGSMYVITGMAPVENWPSVQGMVEMMIGSIRLTKPKGPTARLSPDDEAPPAGPVAPEASAATSPAATAAPQAPDGTEAPAISNGEPSYAPFALADDAKSLDPEHPTNVNLRDNGGGLTPNVLRADAARRVAFVGAGAVEAVVPVPFGWHAIDDGRRTLLFDPVNDVQVNLNLLDAAGRSPEDLFDEILTDIAQENPDALFNRMKLDGLPAMVVRDLVVDGTKLQQAYILKPLTHRDGFYLKVRATVSNPDHITRVGDLMERIVIDSEFLA
ncbi:MAG TPA: hypothetical protein VEA69_02170 [Tepidisphaeraceae bacterium]|nr:hypothetical protein [Tepidisphaeraceae bacterium]